MTFKNVWIAFFVLAALVSSCQSTKVINANCYLRTSGANGYRTLDYKIALSSVDFSTEYFLKIQDDLLKCELPKVESLMIISCVYEENEDNLSKKFLQNDFLNGSLIVKNKATKYDIYVSNITLVQSSVQIPTAPKK